MTVALQSPLAPRSLRISDRHALSLYHDCTIHELGRQAHEVTKRLHPEPYRTYVVDRNINYANYCTAKCIFCNFKADPPGTRSRSDLPDGYVGNEDEILRMVKEDRGEARFFAFGVGSSVNRYLVDGVGEFGGGSSYAVLPRDPDHAGKAVQRLRAAERDIARAALVRRQLAGT